MNKYFIKYKYIRIHIHTHETIMSSSNKVSQDSDQAFERGYYCGVCYNDEEDGKSSGHTLNSITEIVALKHEIKKKCKHVVSQFGCICDIIIAETICSRYFSKVVLPFLKEHLPNGCSLIEEDQETNRCQIKFPSGEKWSVCIPTDCHANRQFPTVIEILDMSTWMDTERFDNLSEFLKRVDELAQQVVQPVGQELE